MELLPLLIIALVCVAVGVVVGVMVTNLIGPKAPTAPGPDPDLEQAACVLDAGLWRERQTGRLLVEMDGLKFHSVDAMNDGQRQRLLKGVRDLRLWSGLPETPRGEQAATAPAGSEIPTANLAAGGAAAGLVGETPSLGQTPAQPAVAAVKRPSLNPVGVLARAIKSDVPKAGSPPLSIAGQIDEILQAKLENLPLKGRAIRLMELPGKGMVVMVGLDQYDSVSAVPDPEIRALLQACVEEWEGRYS